MESTAKVEDFNRVTPDPVLKSFDHKDRFKVGPAPMAGFLKDYQQLFIKTVFMESIITEKTGLCSHCPF